MEKLDLIVRAYQCLDYVTPLSFDCGKLCSAACCRGDGEIWLLPGEKELFSDASGFEIKKYNDGDERLICKKSCAKQRESRPFYCRIFPLFPRVSRNEKGRVEVEIFIDPRAPRICPVAAKILPDRRFCRAVSHAVNILCRDSEIYEHFRECDAFLSEMESFANRLCEGSAK